MITHGYLEVASGHITLDAAFDPSGSLFWRPDGTGATSGWIGTGYASAMESALNQIADIFNNGRIVDATQIDLRIARELLTLLPVDMTIVTATTNLLNTQTGHLEEGPILSAAIPQTTLEHLNFDAIDPSESMSNFVHRMNFKKAQGFSAVERLRPDDLQAPE